MEKKTVAVRLKGGLGNQLFQYAAALAFAEARGGNVVLLTDFLETKEEGYTLRNYELGQFNTQFRLAEKKETKWFKVLSIGQRIGLLRKPLIVTEKNFFSANKEAGPFLLDAYFQSEKYFSGSRERLMREIKYGFKAASEFGKEKMILDNSNSVAIHVRRGDYITLRSAIEFHGAQGMDYFNRAINFIRQREAKPKFFVFSDDVAWCKANFPASEDFVMMQNNNSNAAHDLLLMSFCKHQIISNSSYSWWAAWLNENPTKKVIAPKTWFKASWPGQEEIYCSDWIRL